MSMPNLHTLSIKTRPLRFAQKALFVVVVVVATRSFVVTVLVCKR